MCISCRFFSQPFFYHSLDWSSLSFSSRISDAGESPVSRSRLRSTCDVALAKVGRSRAINGNRELFLEDSLPDFEAPLGPRNEAFSRPRKGRGKTLLHQKEREKISKKENSQTLPPSVSFVDETRQPRAIDNPDEEGGDKSLLFVNSSRFLFCSRPPPPPSPFSNFSPHPPPPPPFLFLALVPRFLSRMQTRTDTHEKIPCRRVLKDRGIVSGSGGMRRASRLSLVVALAVVGAALSTASTAKEESRLPFSPTWTSITSSSDGNKLVAVSGDGGNIWR